MVLWTNATQVLALTVARAAVLGVMLALAGPAIGLHDIDHRFTIRGYVYDDAGNPRRGQAVTIKDPSGRTMGSAKTGPTGFYSLLLHLHNDDLGSRLVVTDGMQSKEFAVQFDPNNTSAERTAEVSLGAIPPPTPFWRSPIILAISGGLVIGGLVYIIKRRKRRTTQSTRRGKKQRHKK